MLDAPVGTAENGDKRGQIIDPVPDPVVFDLGLDPTVDSHPIVDVGRHHVHPERLIPGSPEEENLRTISAKVGDPLPLLSTVIPVPQRQMPNV